ncbi:DUF262 domain-containing protein [Brevundimonas naejangsanensis]|uniref:DUF262 domain-containing protein n=1 Tax=Brevundimonas naejangsanensis TaxID=588932 RepID=UPI003D01D0A7
MADRFSADPTVVFMTSVLDDIAAGRLLIPRFQRPLVWKWHQRRDFLNSIYEGLPIGALMIWVSEGQSIGAYESLGPHPLPTPSNDAGDKRYLMDGVQRISTLYGAMRAKTSWQDFDPVQQTAVQDFQVYADLDAVTEQSRFVREVDVAREVYASDPTRFLPLNTILDSKEFLRFQRAIDPARDDRLEMSDVMSASFKNYKVPVISLKSASLEVVTKSFERVNSRGADMSELHMLNALSYTDTFDLLQKDTDLRAEMLASRGWSHVEQEVVLRCVKLHLGANIYTTNPDDVSDKIKSHPNVMDDVFSALAKAADFLKKTFGISKPELVPYRMQIVGIAGLFMANPSFDDYDLLRDWFLLSTYTEVFGSSARRSENALADLFEYAGSHVFKWSLRELPSVRSLSNLRVDFRAARVKALALALAQRRSEILQSQDKAELATFGREAFAQIVIDKTLRGRAGMRFILAPDDVQSFRSKLADGALNEQDRRAHLISDDASAAALLEDWQQFAEIRENDIYLYERQVVLGPAAERMNVDLPEVSTVPVDGSIETADLFGDD